MSKGKGHVPVRTCVCCGAKRGKMDLVRLVRRPGGVVVLDPEGNLPGRGAYVCNDESCMNALETNRRLNRAFRTENRVVFGQSE